MHCKGSPLLTRIYDIYYLVFLSQLKFQMSYSKGLINKNDYKFVAKAFRTIYFEYHNSFVEIDNLHAFLQLNFNSKFNWKRYDIVNIIIEKVINTGDAIFV